jgi:hypothetical protein
LTFKAADGRLDSNPATVAIVVTGALEPPLVPIPQKTAVVTPLAGRVLIQLSRGGRFVPLTHAMSVPFERVIDTTKGTLRLKVAKNHKGGTSTLKVTGGRFSSRQNKSLLTTLRLRGGDFGACGKRRLAGSGPPKSGGASVRHLASSGKGRFRTTGSNSSTTVKGTSWLTDDRCGGTLTYVRRGTVSVFDFVLKRTVIVKSGHSYLAKPRSASAP